jgi:hypothetical protein
VDPRKSQTSTATPAEPPELLSCFRTRRSSGWSQDRHAVSPCPRRLPKQEMRPSDRRFHDLAETTTPAIRRNLLDVPCDRRGCRHVGGEVLPMASGHLYLVAIIDWASRAVLAWRFSNDGYALLPRRVGRGPGAARKREIFNAYRGAQFTTTALTGELKAAGMFSWTTTSSNACGARSSTKKCC